MERSERESPGPTQLDRVSLETERKRPSGQPSAQREWDSAEQGAAREFGAKVRAWGRVRLDRVSLEAKGKRPAGRPPVRRG